MRRPRYSYYEIFIIFALCNCYLKPNSSLGKFDGGGPAGREGGEDLLADRPRHPLLFRGLRGHQQEAQGHVQVPQDPQVQLNL